MMKMHKSNHIPTFLEEQTLGNLQIPISTKYQCISDAAILHTHMQLIHSYIFYGISLYTCRSVDNKGRSVSRKFASIVARSVCSTYFCSTLHN